MVCAAQKSIHSWVLNVLKTVDGPGPCGPRPQRDMAILTSEAREDEGSGMPREAEVVERWCSLTPTHAALYKTPEAICKKKKKKKDLILPCKLTDVWM